MHSTQRQPKLRRPRRGFTLVELLTVIAIIALLIAILVPAIGKVRESAKETATKATIGSLGTGLETFRADQRVGGSYPPSASDERTGQFAYRVRNPYKSLPNGPTRARIRMSGAGLLVWGLAGADLLGTPGFKPFGDTNENQYRSWSADTGADVGKGKSEAYGLDPDTGKPLNVRSGPFVDLSKVRVTRWQEAADTKTGLGSFEIPAEAQAAQSLGERAPKRIYPTFLDAFDGPILYFRADKAGVKIADLNPGAGNAQIEDRGFYHFRDNGHLLNLLDDEDGLRLSANNKMHPIYGRGEFNASAPVQPTELDEPGEIAAHPFAAYIRNKDVNARVVPQNKDSYLLISAGADGLFGTGDDIANFEHNGNELPASTRGPGGAAAGS